MALLDPNHGREVNTEHESIYMSLGFQLQYHSWRSAIFAT